MILVAGATGLLGSEIVARLRGTGAAVRCLVRPTSSTEKIRHLKELGAEVVVGDFKDAASLRSACKGVHTVISTVSIITTAQPGDSFEATDRDGTTSLIDAAKEAGVDRFVFVSFDTGQFPEFPMRDAKLAAESHLKKSGISYTILQPTLFMEAWLGPMLFADIEAGTAKIYGNADRKIPYVAVADVAEVVVQTLASPLSRNATIRFRGDEVTQHEAAKIFEEVFGKPFSFIEIPAEAIEAQLAAAVDPFQRTFAGLMLGPARGFQESVETPPAEFGIRTTTVREFAVRQIRKTRSL